MTEIWKVYPEDPTYIVSSVGRVARILKGKIHNGYVVYDLMNKGKRSEVFASRAVALAFHGAPPSPDMDAAHDDGDKSNNTPGNIVWKSRQDNMRDKRRHGTQPFNETHHWAKITPEIANAIRKQRTESNLTYTELAAAFGVSRSTIKRVVTQAARGGWR